MEKEGLIVTGQRHRQARNPGAEAISEERRFLSDHALLWESIAHAFRSSMTGRDPWPRLKFQMHAAKAPPYWGMRMKCEGIDRDDALQ